MYGKNIHESIQMVRGCAPAARTSTVTGDTIDRKGFREVAFKQTVGTVSGTNPSLAGKLQHGDASDASDMADISGATFTAVTASSKQQMVRVNGNALKRYVRYVGTITGTTPVFNLGVECILADPMAEPTSLPSGHTAHVNVEPDTTS